MSSSRMEQVFYHTHSKVSHYILRHTSHRQRSAFEHAALVLAVCGFCIVILSHRTFVHREDIASISRTTPIIELARFDFDANNHNDNYGSCHASDESAAAIEAAATATATASPQIATNTITSDYFFSGLIGEKRGVSMYSIMVQLLTRCALLLRYQKHYIWQVKESYPWSGMKKIPTSCLMNIPGFRGDVDVNHILLQFDDENTNPTDAAAQDHDDNGRRISRAFTIHREWPNNDNPSGEQIVTDRFARRTAYGNNASTRHDRSCITGQTVTKQQSAGHSSITTEWKIPILGRIMERSQTVLHRSHHPNDNGQNKRMCSEEVSTFLAHYGYLSSQFHEGSSEYHNVAGLQHEQQASLPSSKQQRHRNYSPIIYSYSHSQGLLRLQPSFQHKHNITTQFIIVSSSDPQCFGEPFTQSVVFHLVGYDTVVLNWILGLQNSPPLPRFVYHWKTRKEMDLDVYDMDHYAFSSKKKTNWNADNNISDRGAYEHRLPTISSAPPTYTWQKILLSSILPQIQSYPLFRLFRFLAFKLWILFSTLLVFFLTTSLVSFTFQETQDRMLEFTLQLQTRVRNGLPVGGLILDHVLENLVFVPIMVGMIFFLIEFYGGDKFLAFSVLSMVWVCEVFSAICIRSAQGIHFFPRVFFLYFTLFHVYFFSCPVGFTYASLASTTLFLFHTMIFFWNRYELPALYAGFITPQNPRMTRFNLDISRNGMEMNGTIPSPPRIHSFSQMMIDTRISAHPPPMPHMSSANDHSPFTALTAPLSSTFDITPHSDPQSVFPPTYPGPMRSYVAAASTSLQSIRSFASIQSLTSNAAGRDSPNLIFQGGYSFNYPGGVGDDSEDDSYIARVMSS